jgi:hypothetical protein
MADKQTLLAAGSVYQLLTAVHLRQNRLIPDETDLLLTDHLPGRVGLAAHLRETGLFRRVLLGDTRELNRRFAGGKEPAEEAFSNAGRHLRFALSDEPAAYDEVYFGSFDMIIRLLACLYADRPCGFFWYEDGFSSYVIDYLRENRAAVNRHPATQILRDKLRGALLYEPRLAMRGDGVPNRPLPKISREDGALKETLNFLFQYRPPEETPEFLFLEQSFRADGIKSNDLDLMRECRDAVGAGRFGVKPHPRNPENLPYQRGLSRRPASDAPWELFLLNERADSLCLLTVCSNAALTGRILFGLDIPTVMLYPLFEGKILWQEDAVLRRYLRRFQLQFAGREYFVPETHYELRHILDYLGGHHAP